MARKTECYVDTSAFIAFLDRSDSYHALFRRLFSAPPALTTSSLVVAEGHGWFLRRYDRQRAIQFLAFLDALPDLTIRGFDKDELAKAGRIVKKFSGEDLLRNSRTTEPRRRADTASFSPVWRAAAGPCALFRDRQGDSLVARRALMRRRTFLNSLAAAPAAGLVCYPCGAVAQPRGGMAPAEPFQASEGANNPVGEAQGIHPGRVAWTRDPKATTWDGTTGKWWEDTYSDQKAVDRMTSRVLRDLTGRKHDKQAWDALFRHFNETRKGGSSGYRPGEKIAIKINCNQDRSAEWGVPAAGGFGPPGGRAPRPPQNGLPSPHVVVALVNQLINVAGVRGEDILLYEVAERRNIGQPIYGRIRANSNREFQAVRFLVANDYDLGGRISPEPDEANPIRFSKAEVPVGYLARQVTEAKYMINLAILRAHGLAGLTLIGKNHFGSVYFPNNGGWSPRVLHPLVARTLPMGSYNCLVDLMGHPHLGGKTMLYMLDGLYASAHNEGNVIRYASLGDTWSASLLASQDPVAIDSVGLDILRNEPRATEVRGNADNYLHEAAQAAKPQSGTMYDPGKTGRAVASLGVHEHWNNATDRRYSRNLGRKVGIELITALG